MERLNRITTGTLVPIGAIAVVVIAAMVIGGLFSRVEALERKDSPSREEFRGMLDAVNFIRNNMVTKEDLGLRGAKN